MELIQKIHRNSLILLFPLAAASAFIEWRQLPLSILMGGVLGILNIRALAWGVQGVLGSQKSSTKMLFFSQFRLVMLFLILAALVYLKVVNIFGILAGLTVVFSMVVIEGLRHAKKSGKDQGD
ncbi:MAG: ATP synthase subunit I [Nitrospirota bacterium]|nr:ATP synthase subunit I [Nitrospirota bacterium]